MKKKELYVIITSLFLILLIFLFIMAIDILFPAPIIGLDIPPEFNISEFDTTEGTNPGAPVTIIEFSDFQCPFCKKVSPTIRKIIEDYGGNINFIYKHFPSSLHKFAFKAAVASECAKEQGKFFEYHDLLFENQDSINDGIFSTFAAQLELNLTSFNKCIFSQEADANVKKDIQEGLKLQVKATPTFFINGIPLVGVADFDSFKSIIDKELRMERKKK